jgi:hypothetical protein
MKKYLIATAAVVALSAPAMAQSVNPADYPKGDFRRELYTYRPMPGTPASAIYDQNAQACAASGYQVTLAAPRVRTLHSAGYTLNQIESTMNGQYWSYDLEVAAWAFCLGNVAEQAKR